MLHSPKIKFGAHETCLFIRLTGILRMSRSRFSCSIDCFIAMTLFCFMFARFNLVNFWITRFVKVRYHIPKKYNLSLSYNIYLWTSTFDGIFKGLITSFNDSSWYRGYWNGSVHTSWAIFVLPKGVVKCHVRFFIRIAVP